MCVKIKNLQQYLLLSLMQITIQFEILKYSILNVNGLNIFYYTFYSYML